MSWAKLDDRYDDNRKIKRAWRKDRASIGLHAMAITYCSRHRTDGVVDIEWLEDKLPVQRERAKAIAVLVDVGLFEPLDDGEHWFVHDYLEYNPSRQHREQASDAARNAALVRWSKEQDAKRTTDPHANGNADRNAKSNADGMRDPMPHPTQPIPTRTRTPKAPSDGIEEKATALGFDEWLLDLHTVTGKTVPAAGTKTRHTLAGQYVACCDELPDDPPLPALKLATRAAHADPHRKSNGYDGPENVLRPTKILNLVDNGRRMANGQLGPGADRPATVAEIQANQRRREAAA